MSIESQTVTVGRLLRLLTLQTDGLRLVTEDPELKGLKVATRLRSVPLSDAMEALAALHLLRWERNGDKGYRLLGRRAHAALPKGALERERNALGHQILADADGLPPAQQAALAGPEGVPAQDLPAPMRDKVARMVDLSNMTNPPGQSKLPFKGDALSEAVVRLHPWATKSEYQSWWVGVLVPSRGSLSMSFNDLESRQRETADRIRAGGLAVYDASEFKPTTPKPGQGAPGEGSDIRVTLSLSKTSAPEVVSRLTAPGAPLAGFIADAHGIGGPDGGVEVSFQATPIREAFGALADLFPGTEWEPRRGGVVVLRGAHNPARGTN